MLIFNSDENKRKSYDRKVKSGHLIKIYPNIYTNENSKKLKESLSEKINELLVFLKISGIISYDSAISLKKMPILIAGKSEKEINIGGVVIKVFKGNEKELNEDDTFNLTDLNNKIKIANPYRMVLQNFSIRKVDEKKINKIDALNLFLEFINKNKLFDVYEYNLNAVAKKLNYEKEYDLVINEINKRIINSSNIDKSRILLFNSLSNIIKKNEALYNKDNVIFNINNVEKFAFFESYFSNYIEGTEFEVDEALNITFNPLHKYKRHKDGNDVIKTYEVIKSNILNPIEINTANDFIKMLKLLHKQMFEHRKDEILVGEFKKLKNKAGNTSFVLPEKVEETLIEAFEISKSISSPLGKAIFFKTVIAEVHPFEDGNGRISRIVMNNCMSKEGLIRIIIPNVYRDDYILALKTFSQAGDATIVCKALKRAWLITQSIPWDKKMDDILQFLKSKSAFSDPMDSMWGLEEDKSNKEQFGEQLELFSKKLN